MCKKSGKKLNTRGRYTISPKKYFFLFLASKFPIFALCFLPHKVKNGEYFFPQLNLLLPWAGLTNYILYSNFCFIFSSLYTNMRVQALNCNKLKIFNLWTKNFSYGRRSKDWYVQVLLMAKRNEFDWNELVTILNIILLKVQYFFGDIFGKLGISCWDEFLPPEKKVMEIFTSKSRIRFAPIDR